MLCLAFFVTQGVLVCRPPLVSRHQPSMTTTKVSVPSTHLCETHTVFHTKMPENILCLFSLKRMVLYAYMHDDLFFVSYVHHMACFNGDMAWGYD